MIRMAKVLFLGSRASWPLALTTAAVMAAGVAITFSRLGARIELVPLPAACFPWHLGVLTGYCVLTQVAKSRYLIRVPGILCIDLLIRNMKFQI